MSQYQEYLSQDEHQEIIQRINDIYGEYYLTGNEFTQLYEQLANSILHEEDDEMFIGNNI
ncbi:hypothetical protein ACP272_13770 (plasmid) [Staphylococcus xylosus]|uniref:hypothetical protein n=1 Tax=Staphylococcus xylosus TaxID=1288 RepID=UPI003CEA0C92